MDKKRIDGMIPIAYDSLKKIAKDGKIDKTYQGGVSSFGAAVTMGSLESAAAFFSAKKSGASYDRKKLGEIIVETATKGATEGEEKNKTLYEYVSQHKGCREKILDAAVAVKLAMNLYELVD